jgi:hypothetical protein
MMTEDRETGRLPRWIAILLVSLAGLLLEVGYTRIVSYKLLYYYTYLVIGLALLGIGSGAVFVAVYSPVRRWATDRIIAISSVAGAIVIGVGYLVIAQMRVNTVRIWDYGSRQSYSNLFALLFLCFVLFAAFIAFGIIVSVLLGRAGDGVGRMYFADLAGAGLGCLLAIPLIVRFGPPRVIMIAALVFAIVGLLYAGGQKVVLGVGVVTTAVLVITVASASVLPDVHSEDTKQHAPISEYSAWGPVFRVDVVNPPGGDGSAYLLLHDATFGSRIERWNGDVNTLKPEFDKDPRSIPFSVLGTPPPHELIIGSAGGHEILASLAYHAPDIEAVELNPVTTSLLTNHFKQYTGDLVDRPDVHLHQGDGRSYLARSSTKYNLVWFVAPDSYAATNAVSSGAFVLSESYLYTKQMIKTTLQHLSDDGIMVVQFGELNFAASPNRTSRYVVTARAALEELGIKDPNNHLLVAAQHTPAGDQSTIVVQRSPITQPEVQRFLGQLTSMGSNNTPIAAPGQTFDSGIVGQLASGDDAQVKSIVDHAPRNITAISDDAPYFWHFSRFRDVIAHIGEPLNPLNPEDVIGERVLLLLLAIATLYAAIFLLAPFFFVRQKWKALPAKGTSCVYFGALGLGFMFFEITMIQRLVQFLGYPTYSLTVTLASLLVSTGLGALASQRFSARPAQTLTTLLLVLAGLTVFYEVALPRLMTGPLLSWAFAARVIFAVIVLAPLGFCLGMFMPLGLTRVAQLTTHGEEYVAWSWAVNGFFSVIGSVLTTILSMSLGFKTVQVLALIIYAIAVFAFTRLPSPVVQPVVLPQPADLPAGVEPATLQ